MLAPAYKKFCTSALTILPEERVIQDYARRYAFSVDASFYRLVPEIILVVDSEQELILILQLASSHQLPVSFRGASTSLSGQAQTDSILIKLTDSWCWHEVLDLGQQIKLGPDVIGGDANKILKPYNRKIGPDPASINHCKIGGIVANNSGGMCCGVEQNSYHTLASIRIILMDGTVLDTGNSESIAAFRTSHKTLLDELLQLKEETQLDVELVKLIETKYRLKNTCGYGLNSLVDFDDPIDILAHLIIGSEGTLGFISNVTFNTVTEYKHKATSFLLLENINTTCQLVSEIAALNVYAVELLDYKSLQSVQHLPHLPEFLKDPKPGVAALLIETKAANGKLLAENIAELKQAFKQYPILGIEPFNTDPEMSDKLWAIRKQTFPAVGANRDIGTTVIIEDVAFPINQIAEGVTALQELFAKYDYNEAIIFGHALDGNVHFVFTQDFAKTEEVERYRRFMDEVCHLVAVEFGGSLKAEHGTGRNMAPFVELEWGKRGYEMMVRIKSLFDPSNLLNPGVLINSDPDVHLQDIKPLPPADPIVDKCIECGFCESVCPSKNFTLTPRQRIAMYREIRRLRKNKMFPIELRMLEQDFQYLGVDSCAATGLCEEQCPVNINTGDLIRKFRQHQNFHSQKWGRLFAKRFRKLEQLARFMLSVGVVTEKLVGNKNLKRISQKLNSLSDGSTPVWRDIRPNFSKPILKPIGKQKSDLTVVYFPSCTSRTVTPKYKTDQQNLADVTLSLLNKAGVTVISPDFSGYCCGLPFNSSGLLEVASDKTIQLIEYLAELTEGGRFPVLFDASPCKLLTQQQVPDLLSIYEPVEFVETYLIDKLSFTPKTDPVMLHVTCSSQKMGLANIMLNLAKRCASEVIVPDGISCCGFAGKKGFFIPELNETALKQLKTQVPSGCTAGYSNSLSCEIGLTEHSGVDYKSILYLVDEVTIGQPSKKNSEIKL